MDTEQTVHIADLSEIRFRIATIWVGVRLALVIFGAGVTYAVATWERPHRPTLVALFAGVAIIALVVSQLPAERIVRSRRREVFFLAWSALSVAITAVLVALDGGASSPLALLLFLPLVFAALSYPLTSVVAIGALTELSFVAVGTAAGTADPVRLTFFTACLAFIAVLCAWQARIHDRRRDELSRMSRADPLTGCLNRRGFEERVVAHLDEGMRVGRPVSIVMLDLDGFKQINDTQGHAAGDELLCWSVEAMGAVTRTMDSIGRLGGDEFAILLPGSGHASSIEVAKRVSDGLSPRVRASVGVASFPTHGVELDELLAHADTELYAVKHGEAPEVAPGRRELSWAAALARAVDLRVATSDGHSSRVATLASVIARRLGWTGPELALLRMAAMLHDVGKASIPDAILCKPGPLTEEEYEEVKRHPVAGAELIGRVEGLEPILPWIRHSHEHFDGSGYPDGLRDEAIPLASRILLVADAYDAMTNDRPYRSAMPGDAAREELRRCSGGQFDPDCVAALDAHLEAEADEVSAGDRPA